MKGICNLCKKEKTILFKEWLGYQVNLCYECLLECNQPIHMFKKCDQCQEWFEPKEDWRKICLDCWKENKNKKEEQESNPMTW